MLPTRVGEIKFKLTWEYIRREGDVGWEKFWGWGKGCQELKGKGFSLIDWVISVLCHMFNIQPCNGG